MNQSDPKIPYGTGVQFQSKYCVELSIYNKVLGKLQDLKWQEV